MLCLCSSVVPGAMGRLSGGSDKTEVPQTSDAVFMLSEGRCHKVASLAILSIWFSVTRLKTKSVKALLRLSSEGFLVENEFESALAKTPKELVSSFSLSLEFDASRIDAAKPG